jgi:hypothetical protein
MSPALQSLPGDAREVLYTLTTTCTIDDKAEKCNVEAVDYPSATLYRMILPGSRVTTVRLIDDPIFRAQIWNADKKDWEALQTLTINIPDNIVCYNNLCVNNPNFVQAALERRKGHRLSKRIMKARFDETGEISASCFDQGCDSPL